MVATPSLGFCGVTKKIKFIGKMRKLQICFDIVVKHDTIKHFASFALYMFFHKKTQFNLKMACHMLLMAPYLVAIATDCCQTLQNVSQGLNTAAQDGMS